MVGKLVGFLKILHRRVIFFKLALCQRKHADDAVYRRANLMRHAGKECGFRLVGFFRLYQALFIALYTALHFSRFVKSEKVVFFCAALHNVHSDPLAVLHAEFCGQMISQKLFPSVSKSFVNIFMRHSPFFLCCKLPPQRATYSPQNRSAALHREPNANKAGP